MEKHKMVENVRWADDDATITNARIVGVNRKDLLAGIWVYKLKESFVSTLSIDVISDIII